MKIDDILLYSARAIVSTMAKVHRSDLDDKIKEEIITNAMYHFTDGDSAEKIIESQYLKPATGFFKYVNSYGTPVACLFLRKTRYR